MNTLLLISQILGLVALAGLLWLVVCAFKRHLLWGFAVLLLSPFSAMFYGIKYWKTEKTPFLTYMLSFVSAVALGTYVFTAWGGWDVVRISLQLHQGAQDKSLTQQDAMTFMYTNLNFIENSGPTAQDRKKLLLIRKFLDSLEAGMTDDDRHELNHEFLELMKSENLNETERQQLESFRRQLQIDAPGNPAPEMQKVALEAARKPAPKIASRRPSTRPSRQRIEYVAIEPTEAKLHIGKTFKVMRSNGVEKQVVLRGATPGKLRFEERTRGGTIAYNFYHRDITRLRLLQWQVN